MLIDVVLAREFLCHAAFCYDSTIVHLSALLLDGHSRAFCSLLLQLLHTHTLLSFGGLSPTSFPHWKLFPGRGGVFIIKVGWGCEPYLHEGEIYAAHLEFFFFF